MFPFGPSVKKDSICIAVVGRRGTGKSAYMAKQADKFSKKKVLWANTAYNLEEKKFPCWFALEVIDLLDMRNGAYLIDEGGLMVSSRRWWSLDEDVETCFTLSRHIDVDVVLACISFDTLDKRIRGVVDRIIVMHRFMKISWWSEWDSKDLELDGRRKRGLRIPVGLGALVHTKKLHSMYDDKAMFGSLLAKRPKRDWVANGTSVTIPDSLIPSFEEGFNDDGRKGNSGRRRQREADTTG